MRKKPTQRTTSLWILRPSLVSIYNLRVAIHLCPVPCLWLLDPCPWVAEAASGAGAGAWEPCQKRGGGQEGMGQAA